MTTFPRLVTCLLFTLSLSLSSAYAQSDKQRIDSYVNLYKDLAIAEMMRTGVPASITLAQGIIETAGGQSDLAFAANNHFGIKCKADWTGESVLHNDETKNECFRKYATVEDSYKDHSDFLKSRPNYAFLFKLDPTDYEGWAKGLRKAGYATNPAYAQSIIKMIVENNLQQYSLLALHQSDNNMEDTLAVNTVIVATPQLADNSKEQTIGQPVVIVMPAQKAETRRKSKAEYYPANTVFTINEAKVIYAESGTSMLALANNYNVAFKKLIEFNDLEEKTDILNASQLIFLEKKPRKGTKDIHIVEENETLHDIAQKEGIQLSVIMEYNSLKKGMQPAAGERIYLKFAAPISPKLASAADLKTAASM